MWGGGWICLVCVCIHTFIVTHPTLKTQHKNQGRAPGRGACGAWPRSTRGRRGSGGAFKTKCNYMYIYLFYTYLCGGGWVCVYILYITYKHLQTPTKKNQQEQRLVGHHRPPAPRARRALRPAIDQPGRLPPSAAGRGRGGRYAAYVDAAVAVGRGTCDFTFHVGFNVDS